MDSSSRNRRRAATLAPLLLAAGLLGACGATASPTQVGTDALADDESRASDLGCAPAPGDDRHVMARSAEVRPENAAERTGPDDHVTCAHHEPSYVIPLLSPRRR